MKLVDRLKAFVHKTRAPSMVVYGNFESCLIEFDGRTEVYVDLHDVSNIIKDFGLVGRTIEIKTESGEKEYNGHGYHGMSHENLNRFREWLRGRIINVKYHSPF